MPLTPRRLVLAAVAGALVLPGAAQAACHAQASYCVDNDVASISVVHRGGTVEVHRGGFSLTDQFVFCAVEYVNWLRQPEVNWEAYDDCSTEPHRVL
jgi:hypothetical protein